MGSAGIGGIGIGIAGKAKTGNAQLVIHLRTHK
jgi:hypothetical protein